MFTRFSKHSKKYNTRFARFGKRAKKKGGVRKDAKANDPAESADTESESEDEELLKNMEELLKEMDQEGLKKIMGMTN
jgi:histidyl-tRNA synthetase